MGLRVGDYQLDCKSYLRHELEMRFHGVPSSGNHYRDRRVHARHWGSLIRWVAVLVCRWNCKDTLQFRTGLEIEVPGLECQGPFSSEQKWTVAFE